MKTSESSARMPPVLAAWVRLVLAFSVGISAGLSPYLGRTGMPGFASLLRTLPDSLQDTVIPLSASAMGMVAVLVQWMAQNPSGPKRLRRWLARCIVCCAVAFGLLLCLEVYAVVRVEVPAIDRTASFAVGFTHPRTAPCETLGRAECIREKLGLNPAIVDGYFGERQTNAARLALTLAYILFMTSFAAAIGVFVTAKRNQPVR